MADTNDYTVSEIAGILSISATEVRLMCVTGTIPSRRTGLVWTIPKKQFHDLIERNTVPARNQPIRPHNNA